MGANAERNAEIIRRRLSGELPSDIRRAMGISRNVVAGVLDRAGIIRNDHAAGHQKYKSAPKGEACWKAKLSEADVRAIRAEYQPGTGRWKRGNSVDLAQRFGVRRDAVCRVATSRAWKHVE
jgi:hypothetical protein